MKQNGFIRKVAAGALSLAMVLSMAAPMTALAEETTKQPETTTQTNSTGEVPKSPDKDSTGGLNTSDDTTTEGQTNTTAEGQTGTTTEEQTGTATEEQTGTTTEEQTNTTTEEQTGTTTEEQTGTTTEDTAEEPVFLFALARGVARAAGSVNLVDLLKDKKLDGVSVTVGNKNVLGNEVKVNMDDTLVVKLNYTILNTLKNQLDANTKINYPLPSGLNFTGVTSGIIENGGVKLGTYTIADNLLTFQMNDTFLKESDPSGWFELDAKLNPDTFANVDHANLNFGGHGDLGPIKVGDGKVNANKTYTVNADGTVTFSIDFTVDAAVKNVQFVDTMGSDFSFGTPFTLTGTETVGGGTVNNTVTDVYTAAQTATLNLGDLKAGTYHLTYPAKVEAYDSTDGKNQNKAAWSWTGNSGENHKNEGGSTAWVDTSHLKCITKTGSITEDTATWTIVLNGGDAKKNLNNAVITDTLPSGMVLDSSNVKVESFTIQKNDGTPATDTPTITGNTLSYTLPNDAGNDKYTLTYTTKVDTSTLTPGTHPYKNEATVTPPGGVPGTAEATVNYVQPAKGEHSASKRYIAPSYPLPAVDADGYYNACWETKYDYTDISGNGNAVTKIEDTLGSFNDYNGSTAYQWFVEDTLKVYIGNDTTPLDTGKYTVVWDKVVDNNITIPADKNVHNKLTITFTEGNNPTDDVRLTYQSKANVDGITASTATLKNNVKYTYHYGDNDYTSDADAEWTYTNNKVPFHKSIEGDNVYQNQWKWDEASSSYLATWTILANGEHLYSDPVVDLSDKTIKIVDTMPDGMTYVEGSAKITNKEYNPLNSSQIEPDKSDEGKTLTWDLSTYAKRTVYQIVYQTRVPASFVGSAPEKSFTNSAKMMDGSTVIGKDDQESVLKTDALKKSGAQVSGSSIVDYTIDINTKAQDLAAGNTLTLTDSIPESCTLSAGSVTVKDAAGQIEPSAVISYEGSTHTLTVIVPDQKSLTLTYSVTVNGKVNDWVNVSNTVNMTGTTPISSTDSHNFRVFQSHAGATAIANTITLHKFDSSDLTKSLSGAKFALYEVPIKADGNSWKPDTATQVEEKTTGAADVGQLIFGKPDTTGAAGTLKLDTVYYYVETAAPAGYKQDAEKHYFLLKGNDSANAVAHAAAAGITNLAVLTQGQVLNVTNDRQLDAAAITLKKTVQGSTDTSEAFAFKLDAVTAGAPMPAVKQITCTNGQTAAFGTITYTAAGTYKYTVTEVKPAAPTPGMSYDTTPHEITVTVAGTLLTATVNYGGSATALEFVNTYTVAAETVDVSITKNWIDDGNKLGKRPAVTSNDIVMTLYANGTAKTDVAPTIQDNGGNTWGYTWSKLPKKDAAGKEITYTVEETKVPTGYGALTTGAVANGATIANTYPAPAPGTVSVYITKSWIDNGNKLGKRPAVDSDKIVVRLYANGTPQTYTLPAIKDNEDNTWTYLWKDLPELDDAGKKIAYTVREVTAPDGYGPLSTAAVVSGGTIANALPAPEPEEIGLYITKQWVDNGNKPGLRPAVTSNDIVMTLYANGVAVTDGTRTVTDNKNNSWTYAWSKLPKADAEGRAIVYSVKETKVPAGYLVTGTGSAVSGGRIVNTYPTPDEPGPTPNGPDNTPDEPTPTPAVTPTPGAPTVTPTVTPTPVGGRIPRTADSSMPLAYALGMAAALLTLAGVYTIKRRRKQ